MCATCEYCNRTFETVTSLKGHYGKCETKKQILESTLTKKVLYHLMFEQNYSANYIGMEWMLKQTGHTYRAACIIRLANKYGFKTRTVAEANATSEKQKLCKDNINKKYGVDNVSQLPEIKKAKENTFIKHYGIKNIFLDKEYIKEKTFQKYGVYFPSHIPGRIKNRSQGVRSKIHRIVEEMLDEMGISYISDVEGWFLKFNEEMGTEYSPRPDILIENKKIIIEIQGDHWHLNPRMFKPTDIITWLWDGECTAEDVWKRDDIRKRHLESFGYKVYFIWEYDILHDKIGVRNNIKKWLE